ncbi:Hypothetical protein R9X50_00325200 [Acrodontium crateriforme]|uniref:Conserved oligomeric Golgi complex subunit 8 n=1 Tax=Acrodontium crateriforme TaxID=150365 RepID=A0AAQ3M2H6_9PEZI|nr:Hypothetical protein R9X50_00325200 [Acrodontium crateriforme]
MSSDLFDLLKPHLHDRSTLTNDQHTAAYLNRLHTLSLSDLTNTEPESLQHAAQSHLRNLQALSKRSHKAVISSYSHLANLASLLPGLRVESTKLHEGIPDLENAATEFAKKYDRSTENAVLDRRKKAMLLARNVDRITDVLELPTLLSSTVSSAQNAATATNVASSSTTTYASALDLHAHIKRLNTLYPQSELVGDISKQAEAEIDKLATILITSLQSPSLKLAAAMRTIGWLRRVAPDLADDISSTKSTNSDSFGVGSQKNEDGALGLLFLNCRLYSLHNTLGALEPLRELAEQETSRRQTLSSQTKSTTNGFGVQSERYLKRFIEIFREQSFAITSMYKNIFPSGLPTAEGLEVEKASQSKDLLLPLPSPLASFTLHLADLLTDTLREYLPNVTDQSARESLLTQVLYCASSLGRLGADFGMMVALLEEELATDTDLSTADGDAEKEWVQVMKKHRVQASRLEVLARGVGTTGRKASMEVDSQTS